MKRMNVIQPKRIEWTNKSIYLIWDYQRISLVSKHATTFTENINSININKKIYINDINYIININKY